jgi:hypothetical protein
VTDGASHLEELRVQLHGVMLRRTKDAVLDLPPKLRSWLPVAVPEGTGRRETRRVLETLVAGALARAAGGARRARAGRGRAGAAPGQDRARLLADLTKARLAIARAKAATTIEFVEGAVAQGEKVIVFSAFDEPVQKVAAHFGAQAVLLTGATPAAKRQALVDRFQQDEGVRVFVANLVAGGVGLTSRRAPRGVQRPRLGAGEPLAGRGPRVPHRAARHGERDVHERRRHGGRVRGPRAAREGAAHRGRRRGHGRRGGGRRPARRLEALVRTLSPGLAGDDAARATAGAARTRWTGCCARPRRRWPSGRRRRRPPPRAPRSGRSPRRRSSPSRGC